MGTSSIQRALIVLTAMGLIASGSLTAMSAEAPGGVASDAVTPLAPLAPNDHAAAEVDGLQYADPTEAVTLVDAPAPNPQGTANASYPLDVPPGHGITPQLAVTYDSGGGNGWMGTGWNLSVGEIAVDTTFGAPHFDPAFESESYVHDGDLLVPNAVGSQWEPRVEGNRRDYTHQVETEYAEIIRHVVADGGPDDYFWEVRGKDGGVRWYGATPDSGGPVPSTTESVPQIDESTVVRDADGNIVRWLLSAERDIGVNLIRYEWDTVTYAFTGGTWTVDDDCDADNAVCGRHTYLDRILYTDATSAIEVFNGPPYEIDFIRESELEGHADAAVRSDPVVDARLGYVDVLADRLARVEVRHGAPPASGTTRTYDEIAARYSFAYTTGWFGKSLMSAITQGVDDLHVHELDYHNDLGPANADVAGFATPADWTSDDDVDAELYLDNEADVSTLGGSETNAGSGNLYIGFNPAAPSKTGSFGGAAEFSGGDTKALAEWIDLNGDSLPDKVFTSGSSVQFRLNTSGPSGSGFATGGAATAGALPGLTENSNFGFQISAEAYPVVALGVGTGLSFSWSSSYFTDVNADGLVDFVTGGQVHFNRLVGGVPTFSTSSADTPVPLAPASLPELDSEQLDEIDALFATQSPPIDTVRRFTAPFAGTVEIAAPISLDGVGLATADGVRVAIQHEDTELAFDVLSGSSPSAFADPVTRTVAAGDQLYFRVGAVEDGTDDRVSWAPTITYTGESWSEDANGLSQTSFDAAGDFTLAGRPDDVVAMPFTGTARVDATVTIDEPLTDDVTLVVVRHDPALDDATDEVVTSPTTIPVTDGELARGTTGTTTLSVPVPVEVVEAVSDEDHDGDGENDTVPLSDRLEVFLAADSPVDLSGIEWSATITYDEATDAEGDALAVTDGAGEPLFAHHVRPHVEFYPHADPTEPAAATSLPESFTAVLSVDARADDPGDATAVVTFKNAVGTVKRQLDITDSGEVEFDVDLSPISGAGYFVDVSVRDGEFSRDGLDLVRFDRYTDAEESETTAVDATLRWTGLQGIFPLPYRGWAVAGYTAAGADATREIEPAAFELDVDEDAEIEEPDRGDVSLDESSAEPSYAFLSAPESDGGTTGEPVDSDRWVGPRGTIFADGDTVQTSRLVADAASLSGLGAGVGGGSGERSGPTRLGIGGPGVTLMFGAGPLGASAGLSPSWGITDFEDFNGDGYPDVVSAGRVTYTDQLGGYLDSRGVDGTDVTNQDLTFSVNGGLSSGMVDIVPNAKGGTNATHGDAAGKGSSASDAGPSFSLGVTGSGGFTWTSPNASGAGDDATPTSTYGDQLSSLEADSDHSDVAIQRAFADVNGDGLADRVYTTADGVFAHYNLGYRFTEKAVKLGTGGFESRESASGGAGLGFSLPYGEFGGGVNFLWNYDWSRYSWRDVNGDGILDQLHRIGENDVEVAFGTGSGLLAPIDYGDLADVELTDLITSGQHVAFDRTSGIGGGASATGYIGPLCLAACYLVIGGGGGYNNSRSSTTADLQDVDGDGFADVVQSTDDSLLQVSLNQQGRTNLLKSVTNPLGGSFTLDYDRDGNTTDHPGPVWVLDEVVVDDGRPGDGVDVTTRRFSYDGLRYDRTHRASLGFSTVTATEVDDAGNALRVTEQRFLNDNVFVAGLLTEVTTLDPAGGTDTPVRGSTVTWSFRDVRAVASDFDPHDPVRPVGAHDLGETTTVASRSRSIAPLVTAQREYFYDDAGERTFEHVVEYTYDGLGNVITERDLGAGDRDDDDRITSIEYSDCTTSTGNGCLDSSGAHASPLASPGTCVNWASYPGRVVVRGLDDAGDPVTLRERSGFAALCDNGAVTEQRVVVDSGGSPPTVAVTDLTVNAYGDYELVMAPPGEDGERYTVRYTYDADRHSDVARVEEFDVAGADAAAVLAGGPDPSRDQVGITSSATFDPLSGRVASRTDANGVTRHYTYDELGRLVEISKTTTGGNAPSALVTFDYHATDTDYAHAVARHVDDFDGNHSPGSDDTAGEDTTATIDTVTFVDGLGRVTQTKRDARIIAPGMTTPVPTRQVTGTVSFDELARPVVEYGPVADDGPARSFTAAAFDGRQTTTAYDVVDRVTQVTEPGARTTTYAYEFTRPAASDPLLLTVVGTDPDLRRITHGVDVRGNQLLHVDEPAPRTDAAGDPVLSPDPLETRYDVNAVGETLAVTDPTGAVTSYAFDLVGNTRSVTTPDQGETTFAWDLAGRRSGRVNEQMRASGTEITYRYDLDRLVAIDNPGVVDDVTYAYGLDNADGRFTAGRVRHLEDRTRLVDNDYDVTGALTRQRVEVKRHNWDPDLTDEQREAFRWTTEWSYDELGRIASLRYPDAKTVGVVPADTSVADLTDPVQLADLVEPVDLPGELVTYDYDSGGMLREIRGHEPGVNRVEEPIDQVVDDVQTTVTVPRRTEHIYAYLRERRYDHRLLNVADTMGNHTATTRVFDADTRWLTQLVTTTTRPAPLVGDPVEIQDITYTYDAVGRPLTYENDLPDANRAINGGAVRQAYDYDGFGRVVGASGSFSLKEREEQVYTYGAQFTPDAPWNLTRKEQTDRLVTTKPNGPPGSTKVTEATTYTLDRTLGATGGPLHVVSDDRTDAAGATTTYDYSYTATGGIETMLARPAESPSTGNGRGNGKPTAASETNVWDRTFTWNKLDQMTSADDGSEVRIFAYDDVGNLTIQDGNLLADDGTVLARSGAGPETIFLNQWVTIRAQKIYKHVWAGADRLLVQMDSGADYETKQLYRHADLVGSTNVVTDDQGRGFQRHEYFPSGEIWIDDRKEEIRTPFQFANGYYEDHFDLVLFGSRWYDTERELFLSPDPVLANDVGALIDQPALGGAYTYAGANGVGNVDPSGQTFFSGHQRAAIVARAELDLEVEILIMQLTGDDEGAQTALDKHAKRLKAQERAKLLDTNALLIIDLNEKKVSIGAPYGPRKKWTIGSSSPASDTGGDGDGTQVDATGGDGGPAAGGKGAMPGSSDIDTSDTTSSSASGADVGGLGDVSRADD